MDIKNFQLADLLNEHADESVAVTRIQATARRQPIAIIGLDCKIGEANNSEEYWTLLREGRIALRPLPESRRADILEYVRLRGAQHVIGEEKYLREGYLEEIDKFDYPFFGLAKQEANLMDPNQRLFLESAWAALEDAGYGGDSIKQTKTGVFAGYSSDFGEDYRRLIHVHAPDAPEISVAGNIRSIIASRIAYHLDLTGPSMMIDTACSSGLVAVHQACRSLQSGECEMALVGAVKIDLIPIQEDPATGIGTKDIQDTIAVDGLTRTFDDHCAGTSACEGVISLLLKPLNAAERDGDNIYAVIVGSAINQDGHSVGITAPNSAAQERLICAALQDAELHAQDISYIEAHGTATRLGDPIEISGIQRAFQQFTDRKQFCAIGSVKSNLGHMDNAAGLAGLVKVILAIKHRQLPASLNFHLPNQKIAFEKSPVYVNDYLRAWDSAAGKPVRAGINSFGLSGTNCHLIVQSYNPVHKRECNVESPYFLCLSARNSQALRESAQAYLQYLQQHSPVLGDLAYTAVVGRFHYDYRLGIVFSSKDELFQILSSYLQETQPAAESFFSGNFRVVADGQDLRDGQITENQQHILSNQASVLAQQFNLASENRLNQLKRLCELYVAGAMINGAEWFNTQHYQRISLPTYPFARERCWVETSVAGESRAQSSSNKTFAHPLLDQRVLESNGIIFYRTTLSAETHWELAEHKVRDTYVLPGTCYVEMLLEIARQLTNDRIESVCFEDILFLAPFSVQKGERKEIHIRLDEKGSHYQVTISSQSVAGWDVHAEATLSLTNNLQIAIPAIIPKLIEQLPKPITFSRQDDEARGLLIGDRWSHAFVLGWMNANATEFLVQLALPNAYAGEEKQYIYHPALLDTAVNAINHMISEGALYLPFSYSHFAIRARLPGEFMVHLVRENESDELCQFAVRLLTLEGELLGEIDTYEIKRVPEHQAFGNSSVSSQAYTLTLTEIPISDYTSALNAPFLVIHHGHNSQRKLLENLKQKTTVEIVELEINSDAGLNLQLLSEQVAQRTLSGAVFFTHPDPIPSTAIVNTLQVVLANLNSLVMARLDLQGPVLFVVVSDKTLDDPVTAALRSFVQVAGLENPQLNIRPLVIATPVSADAIADVIHRELCNPVLRIPALYQQNSCWNYRLDAVKFSSKTSLQLHADKTYVITGGFGALGLEVALNLAEQGARNIALLGATAIADQAQWPNLLADKNLDQKTLHRLQKLIRLVEMKVQIGCYSVDVADATVLEQCLTDVRYKLGPIAGVIHAAGRAGAGFMINKTSEQLTQVVDAKIHGAWNLHQLTQQDPLDFFVLYSSIATVLLNAGQSDYTAANAFLDGLANMRRNQGLPALSICWPAWRETGIAVEHGAVDEDELFVPINTASALTRLSAAIAAGNSIPPVIIIADLHSQARREDLETLGIQIAPTLLRRFNTTKNANTDKTGIHESKLVLKGLDDPDEYDFLTAKTWAVILGITEFDVNDAFSDLGGNSILATQLYREYERVHPGVMEMADLFTHTSIRTQAAHFRKALSKQKTIATQQSETSDEDDIDIILARLARGELSADEAESIL
jgi:acyl transferase domain-containing protein